ncbi:MAG: hypothetical protein JWM99_1775 [Verrucomicrobiales bacterium]|nr:hypothetical protein [Verrucomicrobiales bacterium]
MKRALPLSILVCVISAVALALYGYFDRLLPRFAFISGWLLFAIMVILAGYNVWKKLPFLPLGSSEGWLQFHIYSGLFSVTVYLIHTRFHWPAGVFEQTLALFYSLVTITGIFGLFISRTFPKRLTARGGEVIYEQIPFVCRKLKERVESLALNSTRDVQTSTIAQFYVTHLADFFSTPRNRFYHIVESRNPLNQLQAKITEVNRFLNEPERVLMEKIGDFVRQKDGLDYHYALQSTLKLWLFTHIPLTYGLMLLSVLHIVFVYAFSGGAG